MSDDYQTPLSPGDRLDRYELICPIASGGMASVWVARLKGKHGFEKLVAIKTILPQYAADARFRAMFLDEASILAQIQHANVAQIQDVGEEREVLYLVMEFVDGDSLSKLMKTIFTKDIPTPIGVILRILADASMGLHAAHELRDKKGAPNGLVHRDVSPQNILITQQGATKIIDFGIAKAKGRLSQDTNAGAIKGKISYMAPEQAAGKTLDRRVDVWAVGAILYALYARRTPYEGETELDTLHALVRAKEPAPLGGDVPAPVRELVTRAIHSSPEARYPTALDLSRALESAMVAMGVATSAGDVAAFMATHLAERAAGRQKALNFALKAAADRERVREMLAPEADDTSSSDGFDGAHRRMLAANLDDSIPPPPPQQEQQQQQQQGKPPPRVRLAGTLAYEDANLVNARTAYKSGRPGPASSAPSAPPPVSRPVPTQIGEVLPRGWDSPKADKPAAPTLDVPDLLIPSEPRKKPPAPARDLPPPSPFDMEDDDTDFVVPPPRIASAAGSILGPDVLGPNANRAPPPPAAIADVVQPNLALAATAPAFTLPKLPEKSTPPPASGNDEAPASSEFFDPRAIAAKRAAEPVRRDSAIPLNHGGSPGGVGGEGEMLGARPASRRAITVDTQAELRRARAATNAPKRKWIGVGSAIAIVAALVGVGIVVAPSYAKSQAISAAQQQGVTLTIERATVGWGTAHLFGLAFTTAETPNVKMTASSAILDLRGLDVETIVVQDPSVTVSGSADEVEAAVAKLAGRASVATGRAKKVTLQNGRLTWTGPLGDGSRLDAEGFGLDLARGASGLGDEAHLTSPTTRISTARGVLGPWRLDAERTSKQTRLRVGFDPVLADGPSAIFVRSDGGASATLKITRQPLARLGIPHGFLGLAVDEQTQVEASVQVTRPLPSRFVGDASFTLFDARITEKSPRMDLGLKGSFAGEPGHPLDTQHTQLTFGPLVANAIGAVTLLDESFRVELKWAVAPMPCGVLLKKTSPAQATAAGLVTFDSRRPDQAEFKLTQASTCGVPIFPSL